MNIKDEVTTLRMLSLSIAARKVDNAEFSGALNKSCYPTYWKKYRMIVYGGLIEGEVSLFCVLLVGRRFFADPAMCLSACLRINSFEGARR